MSARRLLVMLSLLIMLAVLVTLPQSTRAARRGPTQATSTGLFAPPPEDQIPQFNGVRPNLVEEEGSDYLLARASYASTRRTAGDVPLTEDQVAAALAEAAAQTRRERESNLQAAPNAYGGAWTQLGPNPIAQISRQNNFTFMAGRIGALEMRSDGRMLLGGATGGVWVYNTGTDKWESKTDNLPAIAIGALAVAPSDENVVYAGTGEGETSGDSAAGNGVLKSLDGGMSWFHVSGAYFRGVATANLVVDPTNADHLYIATIRGRGGSRRTTTPPNAKYGIWESTNGGLDWTLLKGTDDQFKGATDIELDPQDPTKLYASFWGVGIFKSTDGGQNWTKIMNGFPTDADYSAIPTRWEIGISHPVGQDPVLYTGFDYVDSGGNQTPSRVWKSTDEGANWTLLPGGTSPENVEGYCSGQCTYDNVIEVAPDDPNVVFAGGVFDYPIGLGGIYRSDDGGQTWKNLGYDQHPDFHALVFNPANTNEVLVGNDGGVWYSADRGGRPNTGDPIDGVTWVSLNGDVFIPYRPELQIAQFTSIATVPTVPGRYWGGTQDNGTLRKSTASSTWSDVTSGDGGQVLVDPTDANFVYGTYYNMVGGPYRMTDGGGSFFNNFSIQNGLDTSERSEFYLPMTLNHGNVNQLFMGTYRIYRSDNAKTPDPADVLWKPISGDLTGGCPGSAPNGARGCLISAIGVSEGSPGVWSGSLDGYLFYARNGAKNNAPSWKRVGEGVLPNRPISSIAVDRSDSRVAYVAYNGYNGATPGFPGHLFKTTTGGRKWLDISGNLPNVPLNWVVLDPSEPKTLYVGTDTGPFVTTDGGKHWNPLGTGFPIVPVWQLDLDPLNRVLVAGTHGRGAFVLEDSATSQPALVLSKTYPNTPVGPDQDVTFTLSIKNIGNATATGITLTDKLPKNTTFVSASDGGFLKKGFVRWEGLSVPSNETIQVSMTVHIGADVKKRITNKNYSLTSAEGVGTRGAPVTLKLAKPNATMVSPAEQKGAGNPGDTLDYIATVTNLGFATDTFKLSVGGNTFPTEVRDAACASVITQTSALTAGASEDVCVRVTVPGGPPLKREGDLPATDTAKLNVKSNSDPSVKGSAKFITYPITANILLVDNDGDLPISGTSGPVDQSPYYRAALDSYGQPYDVWDLSVEDTLPQNMLTTHGIVVWYTGLSYPGPLLPYEGELTTFLAGGGKLFMSGQDILDQAAGTTDFVHDYLHIDWDGTETQNDKPTDNVYGVSGNPVTDGIGTIPLDHSVLGDQLYEDRITPISPALTAFRDDIEDPNALTLEVDGYKVFFLAFPFEEYGNASQKATLMANALDWFSEGGQKANTNKAVKDKKDGKNNGGKAGKGNGGKKDK